MFCMLSVLQIRAFKMASGFYIQAQQRWSWVGGMVGGSKPLGP